MLSCCFCRTTDHLFARLLKESGMLCTACYTAFRSQRGHLSDTELLDAILPQKSWADPQLAGKREHMRQQFFAFLARAVPQAPPSGNDAAAPPSLSAIVRATLPGWELHREMEKAMKQVHPCIAYWVLKELALLGCAALESHFQGHWGEYLAGQITRAMSAEEWNHLPRSDGYNFAFTFKPDRPTASVGTPLASGDGNSAPTAPAYPVPDSTLNQLARDDWNISHVYLPLVRLYDTFRYVLDIALAHVVVGLEFNIPAHEIARAARTVMLAHAPGSVLASISATFSDLTVWRESGVMRLAGWAAVDTKLFPEVKTALGYDGNPYDALHARLPGDVVEALGEHPDTIDALLAKVRQLVNGVRSTGNQRSVPLDALPLEDSTWQAMMEAEDLYRHVVQHAKLTRYEEQILTLQMQGYTDQDIATTLDRSLDGVKQAWKAARTKLGKALRE